MKKGQTAVAQVVINRAFSGFYPNDICGVVYQNANRYLACQFTFACEGKKLKVDEPDMWKQATEISRDMLAGKLWLDEIGKATHYHAYWVHPVWGGARCGRSTASACTPFTARAPGKVSARLTPRCRYGVAVAGLLLLLMNAENGLVCWNCCFGVCFASGLRFFAAAFGGGAFAAGFSWATASFSISVVMVSFFAPACGAAVIEPVTSGFKGSGTGSGKVWLFGRPGPEKTGPWFKA